MFSGDILIFCATSSKPFANTTDLAISCWSYFSATSMGPGWIRKSVRVSLFWRQTTCRVAAVQAGFGLERGSATARAWAYCVIAEECLTDPAWTELPSDTASADTDAGRFRAWLLMRPASFWTEVFPEGGMAVAKERFQAEEVSGRKRAKRRADLDLQIA